MFSAGKTTAATAMSFVGSVAVPADPQLSPGQYVTLVVSGQVLEVRPSVVTREMVTIVGVRGVHGRAPARHATRRPGVVETVGTHVLWGVGAIWALVVAALVTGPLW